jgi:hypothetical protein
MKFKRRHGEFEQWCVLSESYTATDALPPILPACRQSLLPACVFVTRDTVRHPRRFFFVKFVREPICSWCEAFVNRSSAAPVNYYVFPPPTGFYLGVTWFESRSGDISSWLNFHGFTQCVEENTGVVPVLRHYRLIPNPVNFNQL